MSVGFASISDGGLIDGSPPIWHCSLLLGEVICFLSCFKAEGYTDGDLTLYHSFTLTEFLKAENPVDFLGKASTVRWI